jgi:CRP/FNR family cyclic AMP-dependent transcriptional regulator
VAGDDLLSRLADDDRDALLDAGRRRTFAAKEALLHEGEEPGEVLLLLRGTTKVTRTSTEGREVVVGVRTPGDLLGELGAVDGRPRSASVWALEDVEARVIRASEFRDLLEARPRIAVALLGELSARLRQSTDQVLELGTQDALARVSRRVLELAPRAGADEAGTRVVSQQELADRSGLSREAVVKALRTLRTLGWIRQDARRLEVLDEPALRERAGLGPVAP